MQHQDAEEATLGGYYFGRLAGPNGAVHDKGIQYQAEPKFEVQGNRWDIILLKEIWGEGSRKKHRRYR